VKPARVSVAVVTALFTTALGWLALDLWSRQGGRTPAQSYLAAVAVAVLAAVVLVLAREVRRSVRGERRPPVAPLAAARVAVLSKAAAYGGAVLTGWYAALVLAVLDDPSGVRRERALTAGACAVAAAVLVAAGFVAQRWCRLPPDENDPSGRDVDGLPAPRAGER
jgi:drug/metabolite transporter (DMT)-like permease